MCASECLSVGCNHEYHRAMPRWSTLLQHLQREGGMRCPGCGGAGLLNNLAPTAFALHPARRSDLARIVIIEIVLIVTRGANKTLMKHEALKHLKTLMKHEADKE